ncbi:MAG: zf-HC2 domain-containing protein [Kofleriaceae bacterium]
MSRRRRLPPVRPRARPSPGHNHGRPERSVVKLTSCLDDGLILDYLEHRLPPWLVEQIHAHLDTCRDCLSLVAQLIAW